MTIDEILKVKVEAYGKEATVGKILTSMNKDCIESLFSTVLEDLLQTTEIKI